MSQPDRYTCEEAFRRLDDYVDRELAPGDAALVEEHLKICAMCAREYRFEESLIRHVRSRLQQLPAPRDLLQRISASLSAAASDGERTAGE